MRKFINIIENNTRTDLDMSDAARMSRAKEQGFTQLAYHGTASKFDSFDLDKGKPSIMGGFAPHFSLSMAEANGYRKEAGKGAKTLECLLRVNNPFTVEVGSNSHMSTREEYKKLVGGEWPHEGDPTKWNVLDNMVNARLNYDRRTMWVMIYDALRNSGYDGILYTNVMGDHIDGRYDKIVVFDPRNIRLQSAAFDPAKTQSTNIRD